MSGNDWAPERIWLQRGVGEEGSHTWCEDSIDECEQAAYVRADVDVPVTDNMLVSLFYAAQGNITNFRIRAREILRGKS